jgi:16S rRNA A1518/A1519 N6-dimethyltransferase RsmA/KsgA/DIM1 with predicted DNA glycosylase/AP lyase activity
MCTTLDLRLGMDNTKIQAKKYLGQNFLKNPDILNKIVGHDDLMDIDVIEI